MASSVVLKVLASPQVPKQLTTTSSELVCTSLNGPSSCHSPKSDSPLPLEATPLPPTLPSPKPNPHENENGLHLQKEEVGPEEQNTIEKKETDIIPVPPPPATAAAAPSELSPPPPTLPLLPTLVPTSTPQVLNTDSQTAENLEPLSLVKVEAQTRVSPPSLHANEEMLDLDSEDEMEITTTNLQPPPPPSNNNDPVASSSSPHPLSTHSNSTSPYAADDDFAMFVAQEAKEGLSTLDQDNSSLSPSPTLTSSSNDLLHLLPSSSCEGLSNSSSSASAMIQQFGITAACPSIPLQLSEAAPAAPLDMTVHNFPKRSKYAHRAAISAMHPYNRTRGGGGASVAKTLDLLKAVLQPSFNMEVKRLCDDYKHIFSIAASNIRENTGDTVPQSTLKQLIIKMIEEANQGYMNGKWEFPSGKLPKNEKVMSTKCSPMASKKNKTEKETRYGPTRRQRKPPSERHGSEKRWGMDKRRLDPVKWNPDKLDGNTDFVLGVSVNKALGHSANRGKVYYLHPELFKYSCDGDDKTWLYENKHLPVHGGRAFLMIYSEVQALTQTDELYKDNEDISSDVLKLEQFPVPSFMIQKMKKFMRSVQGYFTQESNSTSSSASTSTSAVSNNKL